MGNTNQLVEVVRELLGGLAEAKSMTDVNIASGIALDDLESWLTAGATPGGVAEMPL